MNLEIRDENSKDCIVLKNVATNFDEMCAIFASFDSFIQEALKNGYTICICEE